MQGSVRAACSRHKVSGMKITALMQYFSETIRALNDYPKPKNSFQNRCAEQAHNALEAMAEYHQVFLRGFLSPNIKADDYRVLRILAETLDYQIPTPETLRTTATCCLNPGEMSPRKKSYAVKRLQTIYDLLKKVHAELNPICSTF